jgi:2-hydroxychromene-2-carboxylate isomerase
VTGAAASFYFDLGSPLAYLAAERVLHVLPGPAEWRGVLARELPGADAFDSFHRREEEENFRAEVERRASELQLQPLRWPEPFPFDSRHAMRVATYAASIGRAVAFAQAAYRQAFAGGHSLQQPDHVLIAAAACEMHPAAVQRAATLGSVARKLEGTTAQAARLGVRDVPAVVLGAQVFHGERALEQAAEHMRSRAPNTAAPAPPVTSPAPPVGSRAAPLTSGAP